MVSPSDAFREWAATLEWLSDGETDALDPWKRTIAYVVQFGMMTMGDSAGSLFYNHSERVDQVADAMEAIDETAIADQIRAIRGGLQPLWDAQPDDLQRAIANAVLEGSQADTCTLLDTEMNARWEPIHQKIEALARANGWSG